MKSLWLNRGIKLLAVGLVLSVAWAAKVGEKAPPFKAKDTYGKVRQLSDYPGKFVVLEWNNPHCPFVQSQYKGKMQRLQQVWGKKGVAWFAVLSTSPTKDSYLKPKAVNEYAKRNGAFLTASLMDPLGVIGRAYGAKTTPHLFIINPQGVLIYNGAVDNAPLQDELSDRNQEGKPYVNYVDEALREAMQGSEVTLKTTPPYGCNVQYK
jgi:peroxiredoxin